MLSKAWDITPNNIAEAPLRQLEARIGIQVLAGQSAAAKSECEQTRALLEARLAERAPEDRISLKRWHGFTFALAVTPTHSALREQAAEALPIERDAICRRGFSFWTSPNRSAYWSVRGGSKNTSAAVTIPAGQDVSVARLKIDPVWDPIRNNQDFKNSFPNQSRQRFINSLP